MSYGPNVTPGIHHRSLTYAQRMMETKRYFKSTFNVPESSEVLFIPGSGTTAIEAVLYTLSPRGTKAKYYVPNQELEFCQRLVAMLTAYGQEVATWLTPDVDAVIYPQYDTATGLLLPSYGPIAPHQLKIVDCVSSFPYYAPPADADIWVTVSGKQLGLHPGLGIVVLTQRAIKMVADLSIRFSCLDLKRYLNNSTPHTPPIGILEQLHRLLLKAPSGFDVIGLRERIDSNRRRLMAAGFLERYSCGPVFNCWTTQIQDHIHDEFREDFYYLNHYSNVGGITQIYLYQDLSRLFGYLERRA